MKTVPLEVVGLMVTLVLFIMDATPPGAVQLIITELKLTPGTVFTLQSTVKRLPTMSCIGLAG